MTQALRQTAKGLHLFVKATPKASRDEVTGIVPLADGREAVAIKVTSVPEKGKANAAIVGLIAKSAGIPKSALEQVAGETDRNKVFRIVSHAEAVQTWAEGLSRK
ncbi:DUF167 family protein [Aestuariivirga sp.]|uniref:DUF167 family protein n=1 Tax=Aestuariivirga sp. TaxID=2650926 RepID=UPI0039E63D00